MIHQYTMFGLNIVLDVYSGAVHAVSDAVYEILLYLADETELPDTIPANVLNILSERYTKDELIEAYGEIYELHKQGLLLTDDEYKDLALNLPKKSVVKALCLHIAHDCNLRCSYCFADTGSFKGKRSLMSFETGKKAIDFVIENSEHRRNIEIDFFGGEPLINFKVVKQITEYAKEQGKLHDKNFRFTITTNGLLLNDEINDYINENMSNVVLSLDGRPQINDRVRRRVDGTGSYDTIVPKFKKLVESRGTKDYYIRGTFTANNLDFAQDVMHIVGLGFKQTSMEPVVVPDTEYYAILPEHLNRIYSEYERLAQIYIEKRQSGEPFNFFHFMIDLDQGPCVIKRLSGCGAGHEYLAITPDGDIYPCHQFVGDKNFYMGNVFDKTFDLSIKEKFEKSNVYTKPSCQDCFAKFYCSGGCCANAYHFNNDINKPYEMACAMERKRVECAIAIAAKLKLDE